MLDIAGELPRSHPGIHCLKAHFSRAPQTVPPHMPKILTWKALHPSQGSGPSSIFPGGTLGLLSTAPQAVLLGGSLGHRTGGQ